ncbi:MAG: hypothetical protein RLZZ584_2027 [Pseudomonadota bacterium]
MPLSTLWPACWAGLRRALVPWTCLRVQVLGDSHVRVFEHPRFTLHYPRVDWRVCYVAGGTATGLYKPKSLTQTYAKFHAALAQSQPDLVILNLGEVDVGHTIPARAAKLPGSEARYFEVAVTHYIALIDEIRQTRPVVVLSAPLPTLPDRFDPAGDDVLSTRKTILKSQFDRTAMTLAYNERLAQACAGRGLVHLDDRQASLDPARGLVRPGWQRRDGRADHHYQRSIYAAWLCRALRPVLHAARPHPPGGTGLTPPTAP